MNPVRNRGPYTNLTAGMNIIRYSKIGFGANFVSASYF